MPRKETPLSGQSHMFCVKRTDQYECGFLYFGWLTKLFLNSGAHSLVGPRWSPLNFPVLCSLRNMFFGALFVAFSCRQKVYFGALVWRSEKCRIFPPESCLRQKFSALNSKTRRAHKLVFISGEGLGCSAELCQRDQLVRQKQNVCDLFQRE